MIGSRREKRRARFISVQAFHNAKLSRARTRWQHRTFGACSRADCQACENREAKRYVIAREETMKEALKELHGVTPLETFVRWL